MKNSDIRKVENLKNNKETYIIRWNVTKLCNYYCDFCIQGNKKTHLIESKGESKKIRSEICDKIVKFIENELQDYKNIKIYLIGGELTILPDFIDILEKLVNVKFNGNIKYHITTNLSCSIDSLNKIKHIFRNKLKRNLLISASFYKQFTTEKEFINKIKNIYSKNKLYNYLSSKDVSLKNIFKNKYSSVNVSISYPLVEDSDYEDFKKFKIRNSKYCNSINYIIIRDYSKSVSLELMKLLNKENKKIIKVTLSDDSTYYFSNNSKLNLAIEDKKFNPIGMSCDAGVNSITIDNLGNLSRCSSCPKATFIKNILNEDIKLIKNNMICPNNNCNCSYYGVIEKVDNKVSNSL